MKRDIYVRIRGGLGNQLFQYAFAYLIAKNSEDYQIYLDIRELEKYYWPYGLCDLRLDSKTESIKTKLKYDHAIKRYHLWQFLYRRSHHKSPNFLNHRSLTKGFLFSGQYCLELPAKLSDEVYLYGYFQNADLLKDIWGDLIDVTRLKVRSQKVANYISLIKPNSISISIRFAKQIELDNHERYVYSGKEYYVRLIKHLEQRRGENLQLVISSNDIKRIIEEKWFEDYKDALYIEQCSATEQLEVLRNCRDYILSNSTFSWWVAYLGSYGKDSIVLSPRIWFQGEDIYDTKIIFDGMEVVD